LTMLTKGRSFWSSLAKGGRVRITTLKLLERSLGLAMPPPGDGRAAPAG
jgi:hypothetical protein